MSLSHTALTRRAALAALVTAAAMPRDALASIAREPVKHPDPRPGITAERVLAEADVPEKYRDAYRAARDYPQVLDGIFCHCNCAEHRGLRSLLSCYEGTMPQSCGICTGEARTARRLHEKGRSLAEIRAAIDEQFCGRSCRASDTTPDHGVHAGH
ncbi:PCYCGC motif-containing (lipo)protein [Roseisolibacter agri]|uniref:Uncharacterized protein n=1 Tax=Roseisolibacter agri TaxID=2014610 RepID=A0AA37VDE4_9BACT|nr:PCYCGC motif-containing (lipo)protein [Roseisolibacter agri]GLC23534.1 hypothetical protein rosag_00470 [Roseisolibacter agri]